MSRSRQEAIQQLVHVLGPSIGEAMVRASVSGHWDKLGLGEKADSDGLRRLVDALGPGLNVFVGRRKGETLVAEALAALREGSAGS